MAAVLDKAFQSFFRRMNAVKLPSIRPVWVQGARQRLQARQAAASAIGYWSGRGALSLEGDSPASPDTINTNGAGCHASEWLWTREDGLGFDASDGVMVDMIEWLLKWAGQIGALCQYAPRIGRCPG